MKLRRLAVAALATSAVLGACGGDDGVSKENFIAKGDALCAENLRRQEPIEDRTIGPVFASGGQPTLRQWQELFAGIRPINAEMFSAFRALEPPEEDRARFERWTAMETEIQAKIDAAAMAAASGDQARFDAALNDLNETSAPLEEDFRAYGFKVCGADEDG